MIVYFLRHASAGEHLVNPKKDEKRALDQEDHLQMAVAGADKPQLLVQELDLDEVAAAQKSLPWWRDRRPDLYRPLV